MAAMTQAERLASIEAKVDILLAKTEKMQVELTADKAELAALKNKGAGILIGVGLVAAVLGGAIRDILGGILRALH